ncbi:MAG: helix-turn-helix domain-containing protein, partial [Suipraeoptans sp.]
MKQSDSIMNFKFVTINEERTHLHQDIEILYVLDGVVRIDTSDEAYELEKGALFLINAGKKHKIKAINKEAFVVLFNANYRRLADCLGVNQLLFWCNSAEDKNEGYDALRIALNNILSAHFNRKKEGVLHLEGLYYEALFILSNNFLVKSEEVKIHRKNQNENDRILEIQSYIQSNYHKQLTLNDLAQQLYLSNAYLSKYIKRRLGLSFVEYLSNVRLFHAVDDLLYSNKKIVNVAMDNGFPTTGAFNKAFRKQYNMTPSKYRTQFISEHNPDDNNDYSIPTAAEEKIKQYLESEDSKKLKTVSDSDLYILDTNIYSKLESPWAKVINISDMELLQRADVRNQILIMKEEIGYTHVRFWNVFQSLMYNESVKEGMRYNFNKLDKAIDFLLGNGLKPFIELAFKPSHLVYTAESILVHDNNDIIFHSAKSYKEALQEL